MYYGFTSIEGCTRQIEGSQDAEKFVGVVQLRKTARVRSLVYETSRCLGSLDEGIDFPLLRVHTRA